MNKTILLSGVVIVAIGVAAYVYITGFGSQYYTTAPQKALPVAESEEDAGESGPQSVVFAGGCFWCTEAVFEQLAGVTNVVSGYTGGKEETADYQTVSAGVTDHAEAV